MIDNPLATASLQPALGSVAEDPMTPKHRKAREAAESFEAFFLTQVLDTMFAGIETGGPFGGGSGEKQWRSMLNEQFATAISKSGGIGIADQLYRQILAIQEGQS